MSPDDLQKEIGGVDIYLLDQILKGLYEPGEKILDAGCGECRNLYWFLKNSFDIHGLDNNEELINSLKNNHPDQADRFMFGEISFMPFPAASFHHVICNAVLHFAENSEVFWNMMVELIRVLKPNGSLFIRMTSTQGLSELPESVGLGRYKLGDGTERFLMTEGIQKALFERFPLTLIEPPKAVNVNDLRAMNVLVLRKIG